MTTALDRAIDRSRGSTDSIKAAARRSGGNREAVSIISGRSQPYSQLIGSKESGSDYKYFKGWPYTCVNAIAKRCARQNPLMGTSNRDSKKTLSLIKSADQKHVKLRLRSMSPEEKHDLFVFRKKSTPWYIQKYASSEIAVIEQHPLLDALMNPNDLMTKWALFYVTIASLELTGRAYWWIYQDKSSNSDTGNEIHIWPLPSSWVKPISDGRGFNVEYEVTPPGAAKPFTIPGNQIAPFILPDPSNPLGAVSPLRTQINAVKLDESIQTAQTVAMDQGIFPGVVLTAGRLPNMPPGAQVVRPVLTKEQRHDIITAIRGAFQGAMNFGEPFIVDGLIESVTPFTKDPIEMAFKESGDIAKSRIFGAYGLNPIIIGEIAGANRAQATAAESNFIQNVVNPMLEMIGEVITFWYGRNDTLQDFGSDSSVYIWIEPAEASDADLEMGKWRIGLKSRSVFRNEYRTNVMGLQPDPRFDALDVLDFQNPQQGTGTNVSDGEQSRDGDSNPDGID